MCTHATRKLRIPAVLYKAAQIDDQVSLPWMMADKTVRTAAQTVKEVSPELPPMVSEARKVLSSIIQAENRALWYVCSPS